MYRPLLVVFACLAAAGLLTDDARAQPVSNFKTVKADRQESDGTEGIRRLIGHVEVELQDGTKVYAETIEELTNDKRAIALGNVSIAQGANNINADRAEFNTETGFGTFYNASGSASIADRVSRDMFGGQEPDIYFYGEKVERISPRKYKITKGAFTTCLQPTPRWQLVSRSATINLDHYAFAKNTLLKVKGVPVLYLPAIYYPINKEDRATGFLMPVYGTGTITGFTLSNAFFWAISRSQDLTVQHDWFTRSGQAVGSEYRYVLGPRSQGNVRFRFLDEKERSYTYGGVTTAQPARRSYELTGSASQPLPWKLTARGNASYFSDMAVQQTYHMNIYDASRRQRGWGGSVSGTFGPYALDVRATRNEVFFNDTDTYTTGDMPTIRFNRTQQRLGSLPLFWTANTLFSSSLYQVKYGTTLNDMGRMTWDASPQLRFPFTKWQFLRVDSSLSWRATYYSESYVKGVQVEEPIWRRYFSMESRVTGPTFTRVWVRPNGGYADGWKHVIEPSFSVSRITSIDNYEQIVKIGSDDYLVGGTTRINYQLSNKIMARRKDVGGRRAPRDVVRATLQQSYYTNPAASQWDSTYSTSFAGRPASSLSPLRAEIIVTPLPRVGGRLTVEYDTDKGELQTVTANGQGAVAEWMQVSGGWSQRRFQYNTWDKYSLDNYVNANATLRTPGNRVGGTYSFNYDLGRKTFLQSRIVGYYNTQCCAITAEYQTRNYPASFRQFLVVPQDRRFNISVTLAGLGTFSNLFGALGGGSMR